MNETKFELKGKKYKAIPDDRIDFSGCETCVFDFDNELCDAAPSCLAMNREDRTDVVFIKQ